MIHKPYSSQPRCWYINSIATATNIMYKETMNDVQYTRWILKDYLLLIPHYLDPVCFCYLFHELYSFSILSFNIDSMIIEILHVSNCSIRLMYWRTDTSNYICIQWSTIRCCFCLTTWGRSCYGRLRKTIHTKNWNRNKLNLRCLVRGKLHHVKYFIYFIKGDHLEIATVISRD